MSQLSPACVLASRTSTRPLTPEDLPGPATKLPAGICGNPHRAPQECCLALEYLLAVALARASVSRLWLDGQPLERLLMMGMRGRG